MCQYKFVSASLRTPLEVRLQVGSLMGHDVQHCYLWAQICVKQSCNLCSANLVFKILALL